MCSWATTAGQYCKEAVDINSSHFYEATIMGLYATMDSVIIADPANPSETHHLVAYWENTYPVTNYRYTQ